MMLQSRKNFFTPSNFALASAGVLGTSQRFAIDRTLPLEEIILVVDAVVQSGGAITIPAKTSSHVVSNEQLNTILGLVKNVTLDINDGVAPRTVVNCSGVGLLERAKFLGNLDSGTLGAVIASQGTSIAANTCLRIAYRIPLVHPLLAESLRSQCLLPVHLFPQDPILTVSFGNAADISATAAPFAAVSCTVVLLRRAMPKSYSDFILANGGFIKSDILETPFAIAPGVSGEQRFALPTPGSYLDIVIRDYLGGTDLTRNPIDATGDGSSVANGFGTEQRWRIESGGQVYSDWRMKQLQIINDYSRSKNSQVQSSSPDIGGVVAATTAYNPAATVCLDFLTDGVGLGDQVSELGSVLDCNVPSQSGLKMELIGNVANVATNGSTKFIVAQRLYGNLAPWQLIK